MGWKGILGFDHGVVQAPLGPDISGPELAAAVANAGGIGLLRLPDWVPPTPPLYLFPFPLGLFFTASTSIILFDFFFSDSLTAAGAGSREGSDTEDEEPDGEAVRGGHCAGLPARGEPTGGAGGEARRAAGLLGRVPEGASR